MNLALFEPKMPRSLPNFSQRSVAFPTLIFGTENEKYVYIMIVE